MELGRLVGWQGGLVMRLQRVNVGLRTMSNVAADARHARMARAGGRACHAHPRPRTRTKEGRKDAQRGEVASAMQRRGTSATWVRPSRGHREGPRVSASPEVSVEEAVPRGPKHQL